MWRRKRMLEELEEEIREHIERETRENIERGMTPEEGRHAAMRKFGNVTRVKEDVREAWGFVWLEQLLQDLRYGARMLRRSPGFTAVAVMTLALGIGANTAIFSFVDAVLLRALPVAQPEQLVVFHWTAHAKPKFTGHSGYGDCDDRAMECTVSGPFYETVRAQAKSFSGVAGFAGPLEMDLSGNGPASMAQGEYVSGDFFSTLGVKMALGRPLGREDESRSATPAIVLSYSYWQKAFGGDRAAVGRTLRLNNTPVVVAGVAEAGFDGLTLGKKEDFFLPLSLSDRVKSEWWGEVDRYRDPATFWVLIVGRLKEGVSVAQAQEEASALFRNEMVHGAKPLSKEADEPAIRLERAERALNGETGQIAPMLYVITAAVGLLLLIACANVAGLMLARAAKRQKEMAVRSALGAGRRRIVRQLLTESVLLSVMGGAIGALVAFWGVQAITKLISSGFDKGFPYVVGLDWRVLAFTIGVTFATGILFGLAPARSGSRADLTAGLKENEVFVGGAGARSTRRLRMGDVLVMAQVALSVVVLTGAGLLVRTLHNLHELNPGFDTRNMLLFGINPAIVGYKDEQSAQLYSDLRDRFAALPGVVSASYSEETLVSGGWSASEVHLDGAPPNSNVDTAVLPVGLNFFSTMGIPVQAGRTFTSADFASASATNGAIKVAEEQSRTGGGNASGVSQAQAAPVPVIINEAFARKFFPKENPVGKHMGNREDEDEPAKGPQPGYSIVGMVGNTKYAYLRRGLLPTMYLPLVGKSAHFELRTAGNPAALVGIVRDVVSRADKNLPLFEVRTQTEQIEESLFQERVMARLSSFFGVLALMLACIGLYGLLSYDVARRTREVGIRMALGAERNDVLLQVVRRGIALVVVGAAAGIGVALGVTKFMASMLYDVGANDPATIAGVATLLVVVAIAACWIPARRAMRTDPMVALRYE
ncbi:MAG TPA: ABC transporter permease [Candidatus Acidoferrum sp.]|nr:ABC transporter permease [Candidatus Acidoferrum sp.]